MLKTPAVPAGLRDLKIMILNLFRVSEPVLSKVEGFEFPFFSRRGKKSSSIFRRTGTFDSKYRVFLKVSEFVSAY